MKRSFLCFLQKGLVQNQSDSEPEGASRSGDERSRLESAVVPGEPFTKDVVVRCRQQTHLPFKHTLRKLCLHENGHYFYKDALEEPTEC